MVLRSLAEEFEGNRSMRDCLLQSIWIVADAGQPLVAVAEAHAVPGRGLEGDRYYFTRGTFSNLSGAGRQVTLIEEETLDAVRKGDGLDLDEGRHRRNLVTSGIRLADLRDRCFRIGSAVFRGIRPCPPCDHLAGIVGPGVLQSLKDRGGYRADVIEEGVLRVGDRIELLPNL
jgi:MOSC domain-containing protein YiiM